MLPPNWVLWVKISIPYLPRKEHLYCNKQDYFKQASIRTAHFVDIKLISLLCTAVFIYNDRLIDFCSSRHDRCYI